MNAGLSQASDREFRGLHRNTAMVDQLRTWLKDVWGAQQEAVAVLHEAYTLLANTTVGYADLDQVVGRVYPYPEMPQVNDIEVIDKWNDACLKEASHRAGVKVVLQSSPYNTAATNGTAWGLYNAIVEYEDYARSRSTAYSRMFGSGANRKQKAFSACLDLVNS